MLIYIFYGTVETELQ